jgi:hypothetical protein
MICESVTATSIDGSIPNTSEQGHIGVVKLSPHFPAHSLDGAREVTF